MKLYLRERGTECWCRYKPPNTVITGMNVIGLCPGLECGEFWLDDAGEIHIKLGPDVLVHAIDESRVERKVKG